jgi:hypothetical protein
MIISKSFRKYVLLALASGIIASAPELAHASDVQTYLNGSAVSEESQDIYMKNLVDNLSTVELSRDYQRALSDLKNSTAECSSLKQWSNPDQSANFVVKETRASEGPLYSVSLSFPQVQSDTFNMPVQIFSNPSLQSANNLKKFYKKTLETVREAARANRYVCSKLAEDDSEKDDSRRISSSN